MPTTPLTQVQSFGDIRMDGDHNSLVINQIIQISVAAIKTRAFNPASPYLGLKQFEAANKDVFFGRDQLVAQLLDLTSKRNLVLVSGASGSGKSSVVRAGLVPQLFERLPRGRFHALTMRPDLNPFHSLRGALENGAGVRSNKTAALAAGSAESLVETLTRVRPAKELWLLVVDQFEEIFTLCEDVERRTAFLDGLTRLALGPQNEVKVVLTMRADFFDRFGPHPQFGKLAERGLCLVMDMHASELRAAIEQPAARHGVVFEEGLVEQIIGDVKGRPGALPLLQYTLNLLWHEDQPGKDRTLDTANYLKLGAVEGALRTRADLLHDFVHGDEREQRPAAQKDAMRRLFLRLIDLTSPGAEGRAVSKRARLAEFTSEQDRALITELVDANLLVSNATARVHGQPPGDATVELAHEALLLAWPMLKQWIDHGRQVVYVRNRLVADAQRWEEAEQKGTGGAKEELWLGLRLQQALELQARGEFVSVVGGLSHSEERFLAASLDFRDQKAREEAERIDLQKRAVAHREQAEQRQLDLLVERGWQQLREGRPCEAILWLHLAYGRGSRNPVLPFLLSEAMRPLDEIALTVPGLYGPSPYACYSPDEQQLLIGGPDGTVDICDAQTGQSLRKLSGHTAQVFDACYSSEGDRIATASQDGTARVWDSGTGRLLQTVQAGSDVSPVLRVRFSVKGQLLYTAVQKSAAIWVVTSGEKLDLYLNPSDQINSEKLNTLLGASGLSNDELPLIQKAPGRPGIHQTRDGRWQFSPGDCLPEPFHLSHFMTPEQPALRYHISPDGSTILQQNSDGKVLIWDLLKNQALGTRPVYRSAENIFIHRTVFGFEIAEIASDALIAEWKPQGRPESYSIEGFFIREENREIILIANVEESGLVLWSSSQCQEKTLFSTQPDWTHFRASVMNLIQDRLYFAYSYRDNKDCDSEQHYMAILDMNTLEISVNIKQGEKALNIGYYDKNSEKRLLSRDGFWTVYWHREQDSSVFQEIRETASGRTIVRLPYDSMLSPDWQIAVATKSGIGSVSEAVSEKVLCRFQHEGETPSFLFSPDGQQILSYGQARRPSPRAEVWNARTGQKLLVLDTQAMGGTDHAVFEPQGELIVTNGSTNRICVWSATTGRLFETFMVKEEKGSIQFNFVPRGEWLACCRTHTYFDSRNNETVYLETNRARAYSALPDLGAPYTGVGFSHGGRRILATVADGHVHVLLTQRAQCQTELAGHQKGLTAAVFTPDRRRILTASEDGTARLWLPETGACLLILRGQQGPVLRACLSPDSMLVATAGREGTVCIWNAEDGSLLHSLRAGAAEPQALAFSRDGQRLLSASADGHLFLWDVGSGTTLRALRGHAGAITAAWPCGDGTRAFTAGLDQRLLLWDLSAGVARELQPGLRAPVLCAGHSSDGSRIAVGCQDGSVFLYDGAGERIAELMQHAGAITAVAFSDDGSRLATSSEVGSVFVLDALGGQLVSEATGHADRVCSLAFSPEGYRLLTACADGSTRIFEAETGKLIAQRSGESCGFMIATWSPQGSAFLTAGNEGIARLWEAQAETRSPTEVAELVRQRLGWRLECNRVLRDAPTSGTAAQLSRRARSFRDPVDKVRLAYFAVRRGEFASASTYLQQAKAEAGQVRDHERVRRLVVQHGLALVSTYDSERVAQDEWTAAFQLASPSPSACKELFEHYVRHVAEQYQSASLLRWAYDRLLRDARLRTSSRMAYLRSFVTFFKEDSESAQATLPWVLEEVLARSQDEVQPALEFLTNRRWHQECAFPAVIDAFGRWFLEQRPTVPAAQRFTVAGWLAIFLAGCDSAAWRKRAVLWIEEALLGYEGVPDGARPTDGIFFVDTVYYRQDKFSRTLDFFHALGKSKDAQSMSELRTEWTKLRKPDKATKPRK